jgi:hypothetical protein
MQTLTSAGGHLEFSNGANSNINSKPNLAEMFSMRSYTRFVTFVQIRQKTWPPCDFENSDWSIFKKLLLKNRISAISWRPVLVVEEARVPGQPPTIGKQVINFIIRVYGIKYKIFHEQVLIKYLQ